MPKYTDVRRRREVLLDQGAALRRPGRCRSVRSRRCSSASRRGTSRPSAGRRRRSTTAGKIAGAKLTPAVLHSTLGRHAARMIRTRVISRARGEALEAARREHRQGRHDDLQRAGVPEGRAAGLRLPRGAARHALALDRDRERQDQELPGGRAVDLERRPARREGSAGPVRGVAGRQPGRRRRAAARSAAHHPLVRPVHRLRDPHARRRRHGAVASVRAL